jgi:adenosylcobyric acid synthase
MLGAKIHDPLALEGEAGTSDGFAYLDMETTLEASKQLKQVSAKLAFADAAVNGYEIHMGISRGAALEKPALYVGNLPEGALSADNQIAGTYLHGLFDHAESCAAWLAWAGLSAAQNFDYEQLRADELDRLADCVEQHIDWDKLNLAMLQQGF